MSSSNQTMASTDTNPLKLPEDAIKAYYNALRLAEEEDKSTALKCFHKKSKMTFIDGDSIRFANTKKYRRAILQSFNFTEIKGECIHLQKALDEGYVVFLIGSVTTPELNRRRYFAETLYLARTGKFSFKIRSDIFRFIDNVSDLHPSICTGTAKCDETWTFKSIPFVEFSEMEDGALADFKKSLGLSERISMTSESEESSADDELLQEQFANVSSLQFGSYISDIVVQDQQALNESENSLEESVAVGSSGNISDDVVRPSYADVLRMKREPVARNVSRRSGRVYVDGGWWETVELPRGACPICRSHR